MKIIITEDQARRLNILNSSSDPILKMEQYAKLKVDVIDKMYEKILNLSVSEIISEDFELAIKSNLSEISNESHKIYILGYRYLESMSDEEADGLDMRLDDANSILSAKINALEALIYGIENLNYISIENELTNVFKPQEPLDITDQQ
jgi:hypothetical protein